jgi:hypothetical protein
MSVQLNTYVMYGVLLPFRRELSDEQNDLLEGYTDSAFTPDFNPKDGLTALDDGMNGEYLAIGKVIAKTDDHEGFSKPVAPSAAKNALAALKEKRERETS